MKNFLGSMGMGDISARARMTVSGDVTAPTVSLASSSTNIVADGSITLTATAADNVGVARVEFFRNGGLIGTDTSSPFTATYAFTYLDNGTVNFTAMAFDAANNSATSNTVAVTVNIAGPDVAAPTVSLSSDSTNVTAAGSITLTATASDNVGVTSVEFYKNGSLIATDTTSPFSATAALSSADNGTVNFTAKAFDAAGNNTTSSAVAVTVNIAADATAPTVSLASSSTNVTANGNITLTATASDNIGVTNVEFYRDGVLIASDNTVPYTTTVALTGADNGTKYFTAKAYDAAGNSTTSAAVAVTIAVPALSYDTFVGLASSTSIASATWDTGDLSWHSKTYLVGDGADAVQASGAPGIIVANCVAPADVVGFAVFFKVTSAPDTNFPTLILRIDGPSNLSVGNYDYGISGIDARVSDFSTFYVQEVSTGSNVQGSYGTLTVGQEYCLEICRTADAGGQTYNGKLSTSTNGVRNTMILSKQLVITTGARGVNDRQMQIQSSAGNMAKVRINRVEALKTAFDLTDTGTGAGGSGSSGGGTTSTYLFATNEATVTGPTGLVVEFGAAGASAPIEIVEKVYTALPVGHGSVTQDRWRSRPITVGGIQYVLFPGLDSDGRADCWIYSGFSTTSNRERAQVELKVTLNGVAQNLFGQGTTFTYYHQRTTSLRWESAPMPWDTSTSYINGRVAAGAFLKHDQKNVPGGAETSFNDALPTTPAYVPYSVFSLDTVGPNPYFDQKYKVGDVPRGTSAGGERTSIGPVHEWFARLVSEVGTNANSAWLTADRFASIRYAAESIAQYPHVGGLIMPSTQRLIDPSAEPFCTHRNSVAWGPCVGIPQPLAPGIDSGNTTEMPFDALYDNAHPANKVSHYAYQLSKDPWHLFLVQAQAVVAIAFCTGNSRGTDGKTLRVTQEEERGFWWAMHALFQAWYDTPNSVMPKPFLNKSFFATAIDNTLQYIRDKYMGTTVPIFTGAQGEACRFWRVTQLFTSINAGEIACSNFMLDYGHIVFGHALLMGYTGARDVAEWRAENIALRVGMGGNWYLNDKVNEAAGNLSTTLLTTGDSTLPYANTTQFKTWYPRAATAYTSSSSLTVDDWDQSYGRDTYLFLGVLNLYKKLVADSKITLSFDPATARSDLLARMPGPYTISGNPTNFAVWAKQWFSY